MRRGRGCLGRLIIGCVVFCLVCTLVFAGVYLWIDRQATRDETRPADAILVLGASVWPGERPSPTLRARTEHAIRLYQSGLAPHLLLSGGEGGGQPPSEAEVMRRLAAAAGIPDEAMLLDERATSTWESIQWASQVMRERGWRTLLIVSDPFHLPRAKVMAGDVGLTAWVSPALDSPNHTIASRRVYYTLREVVALLWYRLSLSDFSQQVKTAHGQ